MNKIIAILIFFLTIFSCSKKQIIYEKQENNYINYNLILNYRNDEIIEIINNVTITLDKTLVDDKNTYISYLKLLKIKYEIKEEKDNFIIYFTEYLSKNSDNKHYFSNIMNNVRQLDNFDNVEKILKENLYIKKE